jgi:hypothetical protein
MPTTLPPRAAILTRPVDLIDFARTISCFYVGIAIFVAMIITTEYDFGMFKGLTLVESIVIATGPGLLPYSDPQLIGMF